MVFIIKRIVFYIFIAASLCVAVWGYFRLKQSKEPKAAVIEHIPANVLCVIETKSTSDLVSQLTRQNLIWNSLLTEESFMRAQKGIQYLDSLIQAHDDVSSVIDNNSVYWSFIKAGNSIQHVVQFKLKEQNETSTFESFFKSVFVKDQSGSSFDVYDLKFNKETWLACLKDGIVYFSSDLSVMQNCIQLNKKESIANDPAYINLVKLNGEQMTQVYFNHTISDLFDRSLFTKRSLFSVDVQLNEITFNGYTMIDSLSFLNSLKNQQASSIRQFENLPNSPASIIGVAINDSKLFYSELFTRISDEAVEKNDLAWKTLNDSALYDIKNECLENFNGEIVAANYWLNNMPSQITSVKINDSDKASAMLKLMSDSINKIGDRSIYKISETYSTLFSFFNVTSGIKYACLNNEALFFFSNSDALNYYQECLVSNNLLAKNANFMQYANDNLIQDCNFFYYENCTIQRQTGLSGLLNSAELNTGDEVLSKLSFTAKNYKSDLQIRINATHAQEKVSLETNTNALWAFEADSIIKTNAHLFTNHSTQENELCFQDEVNQLYLINSTGNLIWKKKITEPIRSKIYTVDLFKNGKLQMLFNTDNYLHLIDRNGNYVQGFPIKLPSKVTSNITLLDYDNAKDYRIFFACADKKIYNYSLYGIKTEGFVPVRTDAEVILPINYVHVGASDYLITADVHGKLYAFSRKGEGRIDFKNKTIEYLDNIYVLAGNNLDNTKIIYVDDKNNLLNKVSLTDKKEALKLGDELNGFKASFDLINDDTQSDILVYGNGAIYGYDLFSSRLIENFNEQAVYADAQIAHTSNNQWLIGFDKAIQKVDVINVEGKVQASINNTTQKPLVSNLYKDGKTYILVIGNNKISCQELN